jgi:hypothetical protein
MRPRRSRPGIPRGQATIQRALPALLEQRQGFQRQLLARLNENLAEIDKQNSLIGSKGEFAEVIRVILSMF